MIGPSVPNDEMRYGVEYGTNLEMITAVAYLIAGKL
jgi:hypothetical protein